VPVDNFYEWQKTGPKDKQPYAVALANGGLMALAGLWENWKSPADEWVRSFTIITTTPNELCAPIHNRMPVILPPAAWPAWLGETEVGADTLKALITRPYPAAGMTCWPVSARIGNVRNNDPSLVRADRGALNQKNRDDGAACSEYLEFYASRNAKCLSDDRRLGIARDRHNNLGRAAMSARLQ
jgi:hypothetical protein